jgi:Lrp/AsnC family transcriptional regulator
MDDFDLKILAALQEDSAQSLATLAEQVGLSSTPCWRRVQKLEAEGVIRRRVALLNADKLNAALVVFVHVRTSRHDAAWLDSFTAHLDNMPEVVEVNRLAGAWDYLLRANVPDMTAYDAFYKRLIEIEGLNDVTSAFSMEQIKYTTALPLHFVKT